MILPVVASFGEAGLPPASAARRRRLLQACRQRLPGGWDARTAAAFVPGRIEVLGKHTDYAGGRSLLCAADLGFAFVARPRSDDRLVITSADSGETFEARLDPGIEPHPGHWSNYPATVVRRLARNFPSARTGAEIVFASDLPPAAGMSSSSAFMIGVLAMLAAANRLTESEEYRGAIADRLDLAAYAATIENGRSFRTLAGDRGVGTFGGSEDHTAILCCRSGWLARYAFAPARFEEDVPLGDEWTFVVASSGVIAEKTGAARDPYNRASQLAGAVLAAWNRATGRQDPTLEAAATSAPDARARLMATLRRDGAGDWGVEAAVARAEQFCVESLDLVPAAAAALRAGDIAAFGAAVDRSQQAAEQWLGNQVPETVFLARSARERGAAAASAFGAGFGGSVWALVRGDEAPGFIDAWRRSYGSSFPEPARRAIFVPTRPGPAAFAMTSPPAGA